MTMEVDETIQSLLGPIWAKRKPPEFKPRSRSLHDLPGGIRVPIIKATGQPRLKDKLQETMAGLQELDLLREMHQKLVLDAKFSGVCKEKRLTGPGTTLRYFSTSKLSDISEERTSNSEEEEMQDEPVQDSPQYRRSFSAYETSLSKDIHSFSVNDRSVLLNNSQAVLDKVKETVEEAVLDDEKYVDCGNSDAPELYKFVNRKDDSIRKSAEMQMRLRRSSFRCEAVLTHHKANPRFFQSTSAIGNYPSPMHAVLRQFNSVIRENVSDESIPVSKETAIGKGNYHLNNVDISPKNTNLSTKNIEYNITKAGNVADDSGNHRGSLAVDTPLYRKTKYNVIEKKNETNDSKQNENSGREKTVDGTTVKTISEEAKKEFIREDNAWDLTQIHRQNIIRRFSLPASLRPFPASISSSNLLRASNYNLDLFKERLEYPSQTCQNAKTNDLNNDKVQNNIKRQSEENHVSKSAIDKRSNNFANCPTNLKTDRPFSEVQLHDPTSITRLRKTVRQTAV